MRELSVAEYDAGLTTRARRERIPLYCLFELTPTCNLRCHFCYVALDPYKGPYLSTKQVFGILDKLEQAGIMEVTLTGGEAMSRRDFPEIYRYAVGKGFLVKVYSNATMVTERIASLFRELPPFLVEVSIYGADADHYEAVTGIKGSFARFERGVELLQAAGVAILMKHTASSLTVDHIDAVRTWCEQRQLPHRFSATVENRHNGGQEPSLYRITPRQASELKQNLHEARTGHRPQMPLPECNAGPEAGMPEELYQCGAGRFTVFIDGLGRASHCVLDREPSFSLLEMGWEEAWAGIGAWVTQPLPPEAPCSGCDLRSGCTNCPARARMATGSPYLKDTYYCDITHADHGLDPVQHPDYRLYARPLGACAV